MTQRVESLSNSTGARSLVVYTKAGLKVHRLGVLGRTVCNKPSDMITYAVVSDDIRCRVCFTNEGVQP